VCVCVVCVVCECVGGGVVVVVVCVLRFEEGVGCVIVRLKCENILEFLAKTFLINSFAPKNIHISVHFSKKFRYF